MIRDEELPMPTLTTPPLSLAHKRLFTVEEYYRMAEAGILTEDDRVELLEGEITAMSPLGSRHAGCVNRLSNSLFEALHGRALVAVQNPIRLSPRSEPQPDLTLLRPRADSYASAHPGPEDVLLLVEVAESSAGYDRDTKLPLYARSGISECWLVDLEARRVEIHREPAPDGYRDVQRLVAGQSLTCLALPGLQIRVEDVLV
jgi:Uma2 family endonuclease